MADEHLPWHLQGLPFDHYERYALTAEVVGLLYPDQQGVRILDVGGHFGTLKILLPESRIVIADPKQRPRFAYREQVPFRSDGYIRALGGWLPIRDGGFDLVCAHDTLEHVPPEARERFLRDLARVARGFLIVNGPVHSAEAEMAERRIARMWEEALGAADHALEEHLRLGLPSESLIEEVLRGLGLPFVSIPNGNVLVWEAMMGLKSYFQGLPDSEEVHEALDRAFNAELGPRDFGGQCYRMAYVVAVDPERKRSLDTVRTEFAQRTRAPSPFANWTVLTKFVDAVQTHLQRLRAIIGELRADLDMVNVEAWRRQEMIENLQQQVEEARGEDGP